MTNAGAAHVPVQSWLGLGSRGWIGAGAVLLALLAWAVMDHPVHYDELLHILSARGLLQTGQPAIAEGFYTRAELFTRAVAWSFRHFGDNPVSARLPALVAAAALAFILGIWVVRQSGLLAGVAAALLLCVVPGTIGVAVFARFYTVHAVLMLLMFIAAYAAMQPGRAAWARALAVVVFAGLIPLGAHFQETTVIAIGAAVAGALALLLLDHWAGIKPLILRRPVLVFGALGLVVAAVLVAVESRGLLDQLGMSPLWAAGNAARYQYYLVEFRNELPLLWPLLPVAVVVGVLRPANRRLAVFCAVAVGSALLVHSVAAQKSLRYVYYLVPLMCVLWAIGLANVVALAAERSTSPGSGGARRSTLGRNSVACRRLSALAGGLARAESPCGARHESLKSAVRRRAGLDVACRGVGATRPQRRPRRHVQFHEGAVLPGPVRLRVERHDRPGDGDTRRVRP